MECSVIHFFDSTSICNIDYRFAILDDLPIRITMSTDVFIGNGYRVVFGLPQTVDITFIDRIVFVIIKTTIQQCKQH